MEANGPVLLISGNQLKVPYPVYPIGLSYLATYLRNQLPDTPVRIFDLNLHPIETLPAVLAEFKPQLVGISMRNVDNVNLYDNQNYIHHYKDLIRTVKQYSPVPVVIGGAGYSIFPELLFDFLEPDFGISGEGEEALLKLIQCLRGNGKLEAVEGLLYKEKDELRRNKKLQYARSLDLDFEPELLDHYWQHSGMLNIQTKRGCPFHCDYCSYPVIEGKLVRTLNAEKVVDTLQRFYHEKNINYVFFTDSVFNIHRSYNHELCERLIRSGIKVRWGAYFTPGHSSREDLELYKRAGLTHIEFGTDSLSESMLQQYQKEFTVDDILQTSEICAELDIHHAHFLILGGKGETEATLDESFANAERIRKSVFFPAVGARIYPHTALCKTALQEKLISHPDELLASVYYLSKDIRVEGIKERAAKASKRWVFLDDDPTDILNKMRKRQKKGPLWEYLIR